MPRRCVLGACCAAAVAALPARAQEATNTPAATQPSQGHFTFRTKAQYERLDDDPSALRREIDKLITTLSIAYGLTGTLSLSLDVPITTRWTDSPDPDPDGTDFGVDDLTLLAKWRLWQRDLGPIDSLRFALIGGAEIPSGVDGFSSDSVDPIAGAVFTAILGRHGFNQAVRYKFNTGGDAFTDRPGDGRDDALFYDTSYLFRLSPAAYGPDTEAATYLTVELNGLYETGGDNEILLGPGILFEARRFALEATVGLPIVQDVDERLERDLVVTLGLRLLF